MDKISIYINTFVNYCTFLTQSIFAYTPRSGRVITGLCLSQPREAGSLTHHESQELIIAVNGKKANVVPMLNELSCTQRKRMGEWMYRSTFS
jgi:hypothetical protein